MLSITFFWMVLDGNANKTVHFIMKQMRTLVCFFCVSFAFLSAKQVRFLETRKLFWLRVSFFSIYLRFFPLYFSSQTNTRALVENKTVKFHIRLPFRAPRRILRVSYRSHSVFQQAGVWCSPQKLECGKTSNYRSKRVQKYFNHQDMDNEYSREQAHILVKE